MRFIIALLCAASLAFAGAPAQVNRAKTIDIPIYDGSSFVTGLTVTVTIVRASDGDYWTGSAWQSGSATVTASEWTQFSGHYYYVLSQSAIGTSADFYKWTATATSGGSNITVLDTFETTLPTTSAGIVKSNVTQIDGNATTGKTLPTTAQLATIDKLDTMIDPDQGPDGYLWTHESFQSVTDAVIAGTWSLDPAGITNPSTFGYVIKTNLDAPVSEAGGGGGASWDDLMTDHSEDGTFGKAVLDLIKLMQAK
jgi:hypothetical protein